jgi:hypothetical protein
MTSGTEGPGRGHRRRVASLAVIALVTAGGIVGFACGFSDEGSFLRPEPEMDSSPLPEASTIPRPDGSIVEKDVDVPAPTCPTAHGGMVIVDAGGLSFCIDSTEVTNAEYDTFLSATDGGSVEAGIFDGGLADGCDSNLTFARITADPATFPVDQVDWCDAYAFCKWAGKRLC